MKNNLAQNAAFSVVYNVLNVIFPLISSAYISRVLGPAGIGKVVYAQNIASYFLMIAVLGIPYYGTREIAKVQDNYRQRNLISSELLTINFISTTVSIGAYILFVSLLLPERNLLNWIFILALAFNYINVDWLYKGSEQYKYITIRSICTKLILLVALVLFVNNKNHFPVYAVVLCLGTGINHVFNIVHARKMIKITFHNIHIKKHIMPIMVLMVSEVVSSLYSKIDITMLGIISTETEVGYYSNAHKLISVVLSIVTAITAVFFPRLSSAYKSDRAQFTNYISVGIRAVLLIAVPACVGLVLVAENLICVMFGVQFIRATQTTIILSSLLIIKGVGDLLCYQAIVSSGNERALIKSRVVAGISNVMLNAILIPRYSCAGAAIASVISELIVNGMMLPFALTIVKPKVGRHFMFSLGVSTMTMIVPVILIGRVVRGVAAPLVLSVITGAVIYALMLIITKNEMIAIGLNKVKSKSAD